MSYVYIRYGAEGRDVFNRLVSRVVFVDVDGIVCYDEDGIGLGECGDVYGVMYVVGEDEEGCVVWNDIRGVEFYVVGDGIYIVFADVEVNIVFGWGVFLEVIELFY